MKNHEAEMNIKPGIGEPQHNGAPLAASAAVIERVVVELNRICKGATFDFAMNVGRIIIDSFYSGNLDTWRHRGPKNVSFRKLAKHPSLPMSPSALYRSVAIYELCTRLGIENWTHVSTSHIRLVLALPRKEQAALLRAAEDEGWPVRRLRDEVAGLSGEKSAHGVVAGSSSSARLRGAIRTLNACLSETDHVVGTADDFMALPPELVQSFTTAVHRLREACTILEGRLNHRLANVLSHTAPNCDNDVAGAEVLDIGQPKETAGPCVAMSQHTSRNA